MIRWGSPSLGRAVCSTLSVRLNLKLIQQHLPEKPRIRFVQMSEQPTAPSSWHTMNHNTRRLIVALPADEPRECAQFPLCFCFSFSTMGGIFRIHHSFYTKTRSIQQSPVSESFLPYAWTPVMGQLCPGAHAAPAETSAGPHRGLRLSILLTPFLFLTLNKTLVLLSQCPLPRGPSWCRC